MPTSKDADRSPGVASRAHAVLAVAERLFAEKGFEAVSISEIAALAGVSKATVFHHFRSKLDLYLAVLRAACAESAPLVRQLAEPAAAFEDRLEQFATEHLAHMLAHPEANRLIHRELIENSADRGKDLAERVFGEHFSNLVAVLREGQAQGAVRADADPAVLAMLLVGANVFFTETQNVLRHLPDVNFADRPRDYSRAVIQILTQGLLHRQCDEPDSAAHA